MKEVTRRTVKNFEVLIHPDESGGFWVECPQLVGCYSEGETVEEAAKNIEEAIELHLEDVPEINHSNISLDLKPIMT